MDEVDRLRSEMQSLRKEMAPLLKAFQGSDVIEKVNNNSDKLEEMYDLIHEEGVEGRRVIDDLKLFRTLYNRFSGFKTAMGFMIGVFTVGIPIILGLVKLYSIIKGFFIK